MVTDNIAEAVEGCKYICIVAPAFAHSGYAKLLKGLLNKDVPLAGTAGQVADEPAL